MKKMAADTLQNDIMEFFAPENDYWVDLEEEGYPTNGGISRIDKGCFEIEVGDQKFLVIVKEL